MALKKSRNHIENEVATLENQILSLINRSIKVDIMSAEAAIVDHFQALAEKHRKSVAEIKKQLKSKQAADTKALGSDAESGDNGDAMKGVELEEKHWQDKWAGRREKKMAEAVKDTYSEKKENITSIMEIASKLHSLLTTKVDGDEHKAKPAKIADLSRTVTITTQDRSQQTENIEVAPAVVKLTQKMESDVNHGVHNKEAERLKAKVAAAYRSKIKAAFENLEPASNKPVLEYKQDGVSVGAKKTYVSERQPATSGPLAILPPRDDDNETGGLLIQKLTTTQSPENEIRVESRFLAEKDVEIKKLKDDLEVVKKDYAAAEKIIADLESDLAIKAPLVRIAADIRAGRLETGKRLWDNGVVKIVWGNPKRNIVEARNDVSHSGKYEQDKAIFVLGVLKTAEQQTDFKHYYGVSPSEDCKVPRQIEIFNLRATMTACFYKTPYTHDKENDLRFERLEDDCKNLATRYLIPNEREVVLKLIANCPKIGANLEAMRNIVAATSRKERQRVNGR